MHALQRTRLQKAAAAAIDIPEQPPSLIGEASGHGFAVTISYFWLPLLPLLLSLTLNQSGVSTIFV